MSDPASGIHITRSCPHLGIDSDPDSRCLFVSDSHRCYRGPRPAPLDEEHQTSFCLSDGHGECPTLADPSRIPTRGKLERDSRLAEMARGKMTALISAFSAILLVLLLLVSAAMVLLNGWTP